LRARLGDQLDGVMRKLGDPPDVNRLDAAFWASAQGQMLADIRPEIERLARESASGIIERQGVGVDWTLAAERASDWAAEYAGGLVRNIADTTQRVIQKQVARYIEEPGRTIGDLRRALEPYFGRQRAEAIAVTEVTRAFAEGERLVAQEAQAQGMRLEPVWHTNRDSLVCNVCAPNDGKRQSEGWTVGWPPAHPRCRCWVTHEWVK